MAARLPTVGGDDGSWGTVLNTFLQVSLNSDGTIKTGSAVLATSGGLETTNTQTASSATTTVSLANGNVQQLTLNTSITTLTLSGSTSGTACSLSLYIIQGSGGSFTISWPSSVKWPLAVAPTLSTTAGKVDLVILETLDGGTTWYGNLAGSDFR